MTPEDAYPYWRFSMWRTGYGTYTDIDKAVAEGELIPFKKYSERGRCTMYELCDIDTEDILCIRRMSAEEAKARNDELRKNGELCRWREAA